MDLSVLHIMAGWVSMLAGALSGAVIGLFFHRNDWAGGYGAFRRRLLRLGHIAFFGIGILNVLFGLTEQVMVWPEAYEKLASTGLLIALIAMPVCCFLAAWRPVFRHLFPIPVMAVFTGIIPIIVGGLVQ